MVMVGVNYVFSYDLELWLEHQCLTTTVSAMVFMDLYFFDFFNGRRLEVPSGAHCRDPCKKKGVPSARTLRLSYFGTTPSVEAVGNAPSGPFVKEPH